jgi:steroid delta-isomerase-like uncharacterized protein
MKNSILVVSLVVLLCFGLSYKLQAAQGITEQDAKVLVDKALKIYNTGDVALIPEVYAPEMVLHASGSAEDIVGHEGIKNWVEFVRKAYPDFNITADEIIVKGDIGATVLTMTGTNTGPRGTVPPTGKKFRITAISFSHMKNGKIVKEMTVYNVLDMMTQLGYKITPPQPAK